MSRPFDDPFGYRAQQAARSSLEERISGLEARPRVSLPAPLVPRAVNVIPSTDWYQPVTSATFLSVWEMIVARWTGLSVWARVPWRTGVGTTGEVRLSTSTGSSSSAEVLPAASSGTIEFRWLHGRAIWTEDVVNVDARRTAGANTVEIGFPHLAMLDPAQATGAGI